MKRLWWILSGRTWSRCDRCFGVFADDDPRVWSEADKREFRSMCVCQVRYRLREGHHNESCELVRDYCAVCTAVVRGEAREMARLADEWRG